MFATPEELPQVVTRLSYTAMSAEETPRFRRRKAERQTTLIPNTVALNEGLSSVRHRGKEEKRKTCTLCHGHGDRQTDRQRQGDRERDSPRLSGATPFSFQAAMPRENLPALQGVRLLSHRSRYPIGE